MTRTRRAQVTLADVARVSRVSIMTVSNVLNGGGRASDDTRMRVREAAASLGYVPNLAARALASHRTEVIGVIIPSLTNNVFADVMRGIDEGLQGSPLIVQLGTTRYSPLTEEQLIRVFLSQRPAGLIVAGHDQSPAARALLAGAECPVVQIMEVGPDPIDLAVGLSHFDGARAAAEHLLAQGYRAPAFLGAQMDPRSQRRLAGFRACLEAAGLGGDDPVVTTPEPSSVSLGCRLFADLMARLPQTDAVLWPTSTSQMGGFLVFIAFKKSL